MVEEIELEIELSECRISEGDLDGLLDDYDPEVQKEETIILVLVVDIVM